MPRRKPIYMEYGPSLILGIAPARFEFKTLRTLADALDAGEANRLTGKPRSPEGKDKWVDLVLTGQNAATFYWWENILKDDRYASEVSTLLHTCIKSGRMAAINEPSFEYGERTVLWLSSSPQSLPAADDVRVGVILRHLKAAVNVLEPDFAFGDDYAQRVAHVLDVDLRSKPWSIVVLGPALVDSLQLRGRDLTGFDAEWLPWGGLWVHASRNPFTSTPEQREALNRKLGIGELHDGDLLVQRPPGRPD